MILTESKMLKILREEYENRLQEYVNEELQTTYKAGDKEIDVWADADQCKVMHDESGIMYTFGGYENDQVKLYLPDEPRFVDGHKGNKLLTSEPQAFSDSGDDIEYELGPEIVEEDLPVGEDEYTSGEELDSEVSSSDDRDYILIDKEEFVKNYSLA